MKLIRAKISNYRVIGEAEVSFDHQRTVIGGANETGKSTLMEAIHRGLFLKSQFIGAALEQIKSRNHSVAPRVEVEFEQGDTRYRVIKTFSGTGGTTLLEELPSNLNWGGEEAERRLHEILQATNVCPKKVSMDRINGQWAHLWVWQGLSGSDPSVAAPGEQERLVRSLQEEGGAVAIQSPLDMAVSGSFRQWCEAHVTLKGEAKKGSALAEIKEEREEAERHARDRQQRWSELEEHARAQRQAQAEIHELEASNQALQQELQGARNRQKQVAELKEKLLQEQSALDVLSKSLEQARAFEKRVAEYRRQAVEAAEALEPRQRDMQGLEARRQEARKKQQEAVTAGQAAEQATRRIRNRRECLRALVEQFEYQKAIEEHQVALGKWEADALKLSELQASLAKLPEIDDALAETIRELVGERDMARSRLDGMATRIKVLEASETILIDESALASGEERIVSDVARIRVGEHACLQIEPGGGGSLEQARDTFNAMEKDLADRLQALGLTSIEQFWACHTRRRECLHQAREQELRMEAVDGEALRKELERVRQGYETAQAELERWKALSEGFVLPEHRDAATEALQATGDQLQACEQEEEGFRARLEKCRQELEDLDQACDREKEGFEQARSRLEELKSSLKAVLETSPDDAQRAQVLVETETSHTEASTRLEGLQQSLQALQPDQLEQDLARLERSLEQGKEQCQQAQNRMQRSKVMLEHDGSHDPQADWNQAMARKELLEERAGALQRHHNAMRLLDQLFTEEKASLARELSRPLADRITVYLQTLFGVEAQAVVHFDQDQLGGIELVRSRRGGFDFNSLSGGAREQVGAAVRLAMAECLARDHHGCLPIVFDDAFVCADPERVRMLQRMLDLASSRGLQVIVLTCNPADYAALGARCLRMETLSPGIGNTPLQENPKTFVLEAASDARWKDADPAVDVIQPSGSPTQHPHQSEESPQESGGPSSEPDGLEAAGSPETEDATAFLEALRQLGGKAGNTTLRQQLDWSSERYGSAREALIASGRIQSGRGRGGSVSLVS